MSDVLRIANCSGFYGDRLSAMREMLEGGPVDVITGDYLAELTMLILGRDQMRDPSLGYARTFVKQVEECLGLALEQGVQIVSNAGGLNPAGLAERLREVAEGLGLPAKIAYVDGDDLVDRAAELDLGKPLTANAYLGAFGIASALTKGADIVVTGRVTDASVVLGPAIARFGWGREDYDELAGGIVAGHIIECGTQATGGNFSGFLQLNEGERFSATQPLGFPIAEVAADGTFVVTKHDGTNGGVTVDTVTAQLVYEIQSQRYLGPDVTTLLDSIALSQQGRDRVLVSGVRGEAPPPTLKVCVNELGGFRNSGEFLLVGLDVEAKAEWVRHQVDAALAERRPESVEWTLARTDHEDAASEESAAARLRVTVKDPSPDVVGKAFTAPLVELALGSYPGFFLSGGLPAPGSPYGVYRPEYVDQAVATHTVHHHDGSTEVIPPPPVTASPLDEFVAPTRPANPIDVGPTRRVPLGTIVHARSGDKGGDANIGLWVHDAADRTDRVSWLLETITPEAVRRLVPEAEGLDVEVFPLPNLGGLNIIIRRLLGDGVAATTRFDPQAKGLGEWVRSRHINIPEELLA